MMRFTEVTNYKILLLSRLLTFNQEQLGGFCIHKGEQGHTSLPSCPHACRVQTPLLTGDNLPKQHRYQDSELNKLQIICINKGQRCYSLDVECPPAYLSSGLDDQTSRRKILCQVVRLELSDDLELVNK